VLEYEGSERPGPGDPITAWIVSGNDFKANRRAPKGPPRTTSKVCWVDDSSPLHVSEARKKL
jgi:hypothetical protein